MLKLTTVSLTLAMFAGTALAQPAPAPPAKGAPAQPPAKAPQPAPAADKAMPPPAPPKPPTAPQEIVDLAKAMQGTWKCTGKADIGGTMYDMKATITHKVDPNLNKFWIVSNFTGTANKMTLKFVQYMTYDVAAKKLYRAGANSFGGHSTSWATYDKTKLTFEGEGVGMVGAFKVRHTEEFVSPKEVKVSGELSKDNGKTWIADHEAVCKK